MGCYLPGPSLPCSGSHLPVKGALAIRSISTIADMVIASQSSPIPQVSPIAPATHIAAAEPAPCTKLPSRNIAPAPRKPMPVITPSITRVGSMLELLSLIVWSISIDAITRPQEPTEMMTNGLKSIGFRLKNRSRPIRKGSTVAKANLNAAPCQSIVSGTKNSMVELRFMSRQRSSSY